MLFCPAFKLRSTTLVATALIVTACSENGPFELTGLNTPKSASAITSTTTTDWDFAEMAVVPPNSNSPDGPIGRSYTFTVPGAGSVTASARQVDANGDQLYAKGRSIGADERGLGVCRQFTAGGQCQGVDNEIGDQFGDGKFPSITLDFTGLAAGTVVTSLTLSSLQSLESYSISSSTDGTVYTPFASGVGSDAQPVITIAVSNPNIKYFRFEVGTGGAGNNYLVASATTATTSQTGFCPIAPNPLFGLGGAGSYTVLGMSNGNVMISQGETTIAGDVGVGPNDGGELLKSTITGKLVVDPTAHPDIHRDLRVLGGTSTASLAGPVADAQRASNYLAGLTPTLTRGEINSSTTFTSSGGLNVIRLGSVDLVKKTLTINGGPNDVFVFNVTRGFTLSSSKVILTGGVNASNVIWNFTGTGDDIRIFKDVTVASGTFLAPQRDVTLDIATLHGSIIAGGKIKIHSSAEITCP
jgi:choice-of-anchor A domain-containing protein